MKYLFVILVSMTVFFAVINGLNDVSRHRRGILDMIFIKTRCFCKCGYPTQPPGVGTGNKLNLYFGDDKIQQNHINAENTYTDVLYEQRVRNSSIVTKGEIVVYNDELCKFNGTKQVKVDGEEYLVKNTECNTKSSDSTNTKPQDGTGSNKEDTKTVIDNENKEKGADRKEKFLNGDKSAPGEATWNVIMIIKSLPAAGGALLTDRHVITAATPLINVAEVDVKVSLGVYDRCAADLTSTNMSVQAIHLHPSYTRHDRAHDLAIVKLKNMVFFNSMIHPICLPANAMSFSGQVATVVSWLSPGYSHGHSHGHYPGYPPGNYPEHPHGHYPGHPPGYYPGYPHGHYPGHPHTHIPEHTTGYTTESSTRPTWSTGHPTESSTRPTWSTGHPTESSTRPTWSTGHTTESSTRPTWSTGHTTESSTRPTWSTEHTTESSTRPTWSTGHTTESSTRPTWSTGHTTESSTRPTWSTGHTTESSTRPTWSTGQTSERTTSERTTSERTTSQRTTSERTTSERYTKSTSRPTEPTSDISVDNIQLRMNSWDPHSMPAHSSEPHCRPRRIHQPVMTRDECSRALSSPIYLSRDKSCLGVFGSLGVFCSGDVGTPIHFLNSNNRYELLGILTDINRCDVVNPALFIRVWDHLAWITKMTHSGCSCKL